MNLSLTSTVCLVQRDARRAVLLGARTASARSAPSDDESRNENVASESRIAASLEDTRMSLLLTIYQHLQ